jgi:hypothetical protein
MSTRPKSRRAASALPLLRNPPQLARLCGRKEKLSRLSFAALATSALNRERRFRSARED